MVEWVGTWMGRRLVGPGIGVHRRMLVGVVVVGGDAAGSDCDIGMLVVGGYIDCIDWHGCYYQTGGDSIPHGRYGADSGPSSGPGD